MTDSEQQKLFIELFSYNKTTGDLLWKVNRFKGRIGKPVGSLRKSDDRWYVSIDGVMYFTYRIIWLMETGNWPVGMIDHINGISSDNRIENLRDVARVTNLENQRAPRTNNKSGFLGVVCIGSKFKATIGHNKKQIYLGTFQSIEEAHSAYVLKKRELHQGCTI